MDSDAEPVEVFVDVPADVALDAREGFPITYAVHVELLAPGVQVQIKNLDVERWRYRCGHLSALSPDRVRPSVHSSAEYSQYSWAGSTLSAHWTLTMPTSGGIAVNSFGVQA